ASIIYFGVLAGSTAVQAFIDNVPAQILTGLTVAGGLLPAAGLAILLRMLWSSEVAVYFFLGFVLVTYLELPLIAVAVLGGIAAYLSAQRDYELIKYKENVSIDGVTSITEEEDFFS